jgi:ribosomal protein S27E
MGRKWKAQSTSRTETQTTDDGHRVITSTGETVVTRRTIFGRRRKVVATSQHTMTVPPIAATPVIPAVRPVGVRARVTCPMPGCANQQIVLFLDANAVQPVNCPKCGATSNARPRLSR